MEHIFLSIERRVGKVLSRKTNAWHYQFKCGIDGCENIFGVVRAEVSRHCGLCNKHRVEMKVQKLRKLETQNFQTQNIGGQLDT